MAIFAPDERLPSSATLNSARSDGSLKLFLAHYILHQSTNGGVIDNTETDQQALAPQKILLLCIERAGHGAICQCINSFIVNCVV